MRRRRILFAALAFCTVLLVATRAFPLRHDDDRDHEHTRDAATTMLAALPRSYAPAGRYVGPLRSNVDPPKVKLDREGIPVVKYPGIGYQANPVSVAQYGLWGYGTHRDEVALRAARWLLAHQQPDGRWLYRFDFALDGVAIKAPWPSAMAQGQAMSLLERVYRLTGQQRYLAAAVRALEPLNEKVSAGGVQRCFRGDCHLLWLEEYPTSPPTYVLNGFMFTLIGLYDLASVAPRTDALALYRRGRQTLDHVLPFYDDDGAATYDLSAEHPVAPAKYAVIHVYLLRALNALRPDRRYLFYANRWLATL